MADIEMSLGESGTFSMIQPLDVIEQTALDYEREFGDDADFLRDKKKRISHRHRNTWFEDAQDIKEVHDRLATHGRESTFSTWLADLEEPITIRKAQRYILRLNFITTTRRDKKDYLLSLPVSVVDEAAAPSASQELKDGVLNGTVKNLKQVNEIKYGAKESSKVAELENRIKELESKNAQTEQERDEANALAHKLNLAQGVAMTKQAEYAEAKQDAEEERDKAKAEADRLREALEADRSKPQAEPEVRVVEKRVEVIPDDYKKAFMENQRMKKELAAHRAHEQGLTVQELAQIDNDFEDLKKSDEEEERTSERLEYFGTLSSFFPEGQIEARELARCFLKYHGHEAAEVRSVQRNLKMAIDSLTWIYEALTKPKLEVVK